MRISLILCNPMPRCGVRPSTSSGRLEPVEAARSDPCQSVFIRGSYDPCSSVAHMTRVHPWPCFGYASLSNPNVTFDPWIRIGRRMRFGCSIIRSMASFLDFGSGRCLNTGLRVLTKSRNRSASMCLSRNARVGGSLLMSCSSTSTCCWSR